MRCGGIWCVTSSPAFAGHFTCTLAFSTDSRSMRRWVKIGCTLYMIYISVCLVIYRGWQLSKKWRRGASGKETPNLIKLDLIQPDVDPLAAYKWFMARGPPTTNEFEPVHGCMMRNDVDGFQILHKICWDGRGMFTACEGIPIGGQLFNLDGYPGFDLHLLPLNETVERLQVCHDAVLRWTFSFEQVSVHHTPEHPHALHQCSVAPHHLSKAEAP